MAHSIGAAPRTAYWGPVNGRWAPPDAPSPGPRAGPDGTRRAQPPGAAGRGGTARRDATGRRSSDACARREIIMKYVLSTRHRISNIYMLHMCLHTRSRDSTAHVPRQVTVLRNISSRALGDTRHAHAGAAAVRVVGPSTLYETSSQNKGNSMCMQWLALRRSRTPRSPGVR
jgi:hypothetical protein